MNLSTKTFSILLVVFSLGLLAFVSSSHPQLEVQSQNDDATSEFVPPALKRTDQNPNALPLWYRHDMLPPQFDWRAYGSVGEVRNSQADPSDPDYSDSYVTEPKNQGSCGSCYSFGALGSFEAFLGRKGQGTLDLSEDNVKNCNISSLSEPGTCGSGGNFLQVSDLLNKYGSVLETADMYNASSQTGTDCTRSDYNYTLLGWLEVGTNGEYTDQDTLKNYLVNYGPLEISVKADNPGTTGEKFMNYSGGDPIYMPLTTSDGTDHSVLLTGWNDNTTHDGGQGVWIIKNSWGEYWGKNGYGEVAYGSANLGLGSVYVPNDYKIYDSNDELLFYNTYGLSSAYYPSATQHGMVQFTPTQNNCATHVEILMTDSSSDIDITLYDDTTAETDFWGNSVLEPSNAIVSIQDKSLVAGGNISLEFDTPIQLTANDDVYVAVSLGSGNLSADAKSTDTGRSYASYDGGQTWKTWNNDNGSLNIRLRTGSCSGPPDPTATPTPTPFVPTATSEPLPTYTPTNTPVPEEPTPTPTATTAVDMTCTSLLGKIKSPETNKVNQFHAIHVVPLQPEPFQFERFPSSKAGAVSLPHLDSSLMMALYQSVTLQKTNSTTYATGMTPEEKPEPNVTGRVLLPNEVHVENAWVGVWLLNLQGIPYFGGEHVAWTDSDGNFGFNLEEGNYFMEIEPPDTIAGITTLMAYTFTVAYDDNSEPIPVDLGNMIMPEARKLIKGRIIDVDGDYPSEEMTITAFDQEKGRLVHAYTGMTGTYTLQVGKGTWEVEVLLDNSSGHISIPQSQRVTFVKSEERHETRRRVNFRLAETNAQLMGTILDPYGEPLVMSDSEGINYNVEVSALNMESDRHYSSYVADNGQFTIPLLAGVYHVELWLNRGVYPQYTAPVFDGLVEIVGDVDLGDIVVIPNVGIIAGKITDSDGKPTTGVYVDAWQEDGLWVYGSTNSDGDYRINVPAGKWEVVPSVPEYQANLFIGHPRKLTVDNPLVGTMPITVFNNITFTLEPAAGYVYGKVVDQNGDVLTDIEAEAYVRRGVDPRPLNTMSTKWGQFKMKVPFGDLHVGLFLTPNSGYTFLEEVVPDSQSPKKMTAILELVENNANIVGSIQDEAGQPVVDTVGVVFAELSDSNIWQRSMIDTDDGSYSLSVVPGTWYLSYEVYTDTYMTNPTDFVTVTVQADETISQNLVLNPLDGFISGTVEDESGNPQPNVTVWIKSGTYEGYVTTDENGEFIIYAPQISSTNEFSGAYQIGTALQQCNPDPDSPIGCDIDAEPLQIDAEPLSKLQTPRLKANTKLVIRGSDAYLVGQVINGSDDTPAVGALVSGFNDIGKQSIMAISDDDGCFFTHIDQTNTYNWNLDAMYEFEESGWKYYSTGELNLSGSQYNAKVITGNGEESINSLSTGSTLEVNYADSLPASETHTFKNSDGWTYTLQDRTHIQVPANAIDTQDEYVRVSIEPTVYVPSTYLYEPINYGYIVTFYGGSSGQKITKSFHQDISITFEYSSSSLSSKNISDSSLKGAYIAGDAWQLENNVTLDSISENLTVQTDHSGTFALLSKNQADEFQVQSMTMVYLPLILK